MKTVVY